MSSTVTRLGGELWLLHLTPLWAIKIVIAVVLA